MLYVLHVMYVLYARTVVSSVLHFLYVLYAHTVVSSVLHFLYVLYARTVVSSVLCFTLYSAPKRIGTTPVEIAATHSTVIATTKNHHPTLVQNR